MRDLNSVGEKLLSCSQKEIVTYMFLREKSMTMIRLNREIPYCDVGESVASLIEKGLVTFRGEEVYAL